MAKKIVKWCIFKKTAGIPYPGEHWDECKNERDAKKQLSEVYMTDVFRIVKVTYEAV